MDIDLLRTFLEVNRTRHFGRAAENLFVSQSAVSARIRQLEEMIGVPLFARARHDIHLTPAGRKLLAHAENILNTWNRVRQEIALEDDGRTALTVGATLSLWDICLQDWVISLHHKQAELVLNLEVQNDELLRRRLLDKTLDLAFMFETPQMAELQVIEIARIPLVMVSDQKDIALEQAIKKDYILVDWGASFAHEHARRFPGIITPLMRVGLGRIALAFMRKCGGNAYLAKPMVEECIENGELHLVADAPVIERIAFAVYPGNSEKALIINDCLAFFR